VNQGKLNAMSKTEIINELSKLTPEELEEVRLKLAELRREQWIDDGELSDEDKALFEQRIADYQKDPSAGSSWEEVEARIRAHLKK
jgi:putative addiction module component (TIGR02574 family)